MDKIINELYYMVDEWAGQQYEMGKGVKALEEEKCALEGEIARRVGDDGEGLVEALSGLSLKLESIHDKALFLAAVRLGAALAPGYNLCGPEALSGEPPAFGPMPGEAPVGRKAK